MSLIWRATKLWWQHWIGILVLNMLWFFLQLPIISGPPSTAAFFAIVKRMIEGEVWDTRDMWDELQRLFWPAWRWAVVSVVFAVVVIGNFVIYQARVGGLWTTLRLMWGVIALLWLAVNLFYWPFWLHQTDKSLHTTVMNALRFMVQHTASGLLFLVSTMVLLVLGTIMVLPLVFGLVGFIMIVALLLVERGLGFEKGRT